MQKFNVISHEGKSKEEALIKCLEELKLTKEEVFLNSEYIEGKLFKSAKYIVSALPKIEVKKYIEKYIDELSDLMNIKIETDILETNDVFNITLISDNNAILIGKEGKNLNAIQTLLRQTIKSRMQINLKINIDVANYKIKKLKNIEIEVKKIIKEVEKSKISATLDPMNSYERRFVHNMVNEYPNLETESIGEGRDRRVTIKYVEK